MKFISQSFNYQITDIKIKSVFFIVWLFIISMWSNYLLNNPTYNWDMLGYMGVVTEYSHTSKSDIRNIVYTELKESVSENEYKILTKSNQFRVNCETDDDFFYEQLSFYRVKPLYTYSMYLLTKLGFSLVFSSYLISVICYGLICFIMFINLLSIKTSYKTFLGLIILIFLPPLNNLATVSTPDALSTLLLLVAYLFFIYKKNRFCLLFLVISTFARIDNSIIMAIFICFFIYNSSYWKKFANLKKTLFVIILFITLLISTFFITVLLTPNSFSWLTKFGHLNSIKSYLSVCRSSLITFGLYSTTPIFIFMLLFLYNNLYENYKKLILIIGISLLIRLLGFPSFQERFFVHFELIIILAIFNHFINTKNLTPKKLIEN